MTAANNPDNAESLAGSVVLACALAPPFAALFVALRFYTARKILRTIHVDDCK
jgi:ABC-type amino acid transport system permease subunit